MGNLISNKIEPIVNDYDDIFVLCLDRMEKGKYNNLENIMLSNSMVNKCSRCNLNIQYVCVNIWLCDKTHKICDSCKIADNTYSYV